MDYELPKIWKLPHSPRHRAGEIVSGEVELDEISSVRERNRYLPGEPVRCQMKSS